MASNTLTPSAEILDGRKLAAELQAGIADRVAAFARQTGVTPALAAVLVGDDPASAVYVRNKRAACKKVGIDGQQVVLPSSTSASELLAQVDRLNADPAVHGILVQLPLPKHIDSTPILDRVHPLKDVDGFHPHNVGLLAQGRPRFIPCTPRGVLQILAHHKIAIAEKHVVIVGRSEIVGKPLALLVAAKDSMWGPEMANGTVTVCHSRTRSLDEITRRADILIAALGQPAAIIASMVRPSAVVVDVGINRTEQGIVGDVDFADVSKVASFITPVPGGIGPLTVTMLLENTLLAARLQRSAGGVSG